MTIPPHLRGSRSVDAMRLGVRPTAPPDDAPGYYALVYLGGADLAVDQYDSDGLWVQRLATAEVPNLNGVGANDSALLVPVDGAGLVGAETAIFTAERTDTYSDDFSTNNLYGVWSWDWRADALVAFVEEYTGELYFRPQLGFAAAAGWLHWHTVLDRPSDAGSDLRLMRRARANLSSISLDSLGGGDIDNLPFSGGHGWMSNTAYRYRWTWDEEGPATRTGRSLVGSSGGGFVADIGFELAQGCPDPAGGDTSIGGRPDLGGAALNRATSTTIAAAWSDAIPAEAVRPLAATVDAAGNVVVPYLLSDGSVQVFLGSPAAAAAAIVTILDPQPEAVFLAVSARP